MRENVKRVTESGGRVRENVKRVTESGGRVWRVIRAYVRGDIRGGAHKRSHI